MRRKIVVYVTIPPQAGFYRKSLEDKDPELDVNVFLGDREAAKAAMADADLLMAFGANLKEDFFEHAPKLKWVHALGTGVDGIVDSKHIRKDVLVTSTRGIHGEPMSEAAIMFMLTMARNFRRTLDQQQQQHWERFFPTLLHGKTLGILGVGLIAESLAPRCKALGMTVVGISRSQRKPPGFDRIAPRDDLAKSVADLDFLVLLVPYEKETHHLVDEKVLAAMKPTAFLVNIARGGVIDEAALIRALNDGTIAGAALDAYEVEPLPKGHPMWTTKNVIVSPHMTGTWDGYATACFRQFAQNYDCFVAGKLDQMINREQIIP
jgi:phosphoglycerate dehydrogenase-like enzyme